MVCESLFKRWQSTCVCILLGAGVFCSVPYVGLSRVQSAEVQFSSPLSVYLHNNKVAETESDVELVIERGITKWTGNAALTWDVEIPETDEYELYLIASVSEIGDGTTLFVKTATDTYPFSVNQTSGPFPGGENFAVQQPLNFERVKLDGVIALEAGKQKITLSTSEVEKEGVVIDFRTLELLPVSKKATILSDEARAKSARASFDWMNKAGYGLMFHWTSQCVQQEGPRKTFEEAVNDFDVQKWADMVEETGAGYVYVTIGHAESYCPAPLESWERIHPGQTTQRDLIEEMANALNEKGIRFLCYINGPLGFKFPRYGQATPEQKEAFVANVHDILTEMGNRYGDKIAGYWFDTMIAIFKEYPQTPFEDLFNAAKTGNKDRLICLNAWIWPDVSPWQDYWPGEVQEPIAVPVNGFMKNGPSPNLPFQVLLTMEKHSWMARKSGIPDPKFTSEQLSSYIKDCMENGGAVTINMAIFQDGTVGEKALQVMREVKESIR
ncbi:Alpha-L-fucosidase [Novipirellula aureliae]|uniref:alpha-L-fucosidase n=1 Tax=Novipirellula aureliae TaxID=2527966 RepID=A0A5C6E917_9BACT|nr:alpha-L-fucosidase [Novipirellula aureliae]TWU44211.1 Alpha-L-fucosidase [Novipirellula aureliae]